MGAGDKGMGVIDEGWGEGKGGGWGETRGLGGGAGIVGKEVDCKLCSSKPKRAVLLPLPLPLPPQNKPQTPQPSPLTNHTMIFQSESG